MNTAHPLSNPGERRIEARDASCVKSVEAGGRVIVTGNRGNSSTYQWFATQGTSHE